MVSGVVFDTLVRIPPMLPLASVRIPPMLPARVVRKPPILPAEVVFNPPMFPAKVEVESARVKRDAQTIGFNLLIVSPGELRLNWDGWLTPNSPASLSGLSQPLQIAFVPYLSSIVPNCSKAWLIA